MSASLIGNRSGIQIKVEAQKLEIDPDRAVPFGLLVNELATNAIKHAFPGGTGHILLSVEQIGDEMELTVADDGVGMKDKDSARRFPRNVVPTMSRFSYGNLAASSPRRGRMSREPASG